MEEIRNYINARYDRWAEYATYQTSRAAMPDDAYDVLNEVLCALLKKDEGFLKGLYERKKGKYRELDFYILRMLNLNVNSLTSPYRHKYRNLPIDLNKEVSFVDDDNDECELSEDNFSIQGTVMIEDLELDHSDNNEEICNNYNTIRDIVDQMKVTEKEKAIFYWRFLQHEPFTAWPGSGESMTELYSSFNKVKHLVKRELEKTIVCGSITKAINDLPEKPVKHLARLIYVHGIDPDHLRLAGFPTKYLFPLYTRMQEQIKTLAINNLK